MRKLAYIFFIALFLFGCATRGPTNHILNVSYDPADYPPQFFSPKDKPPTLYIDSVVDNREFVIGEDELKSPFWAGSGSETSRTGRFKEDPTLISMSVHVYGNYTFFRTSKTPPVIIREALETEVHRFGIKTVKDRDSADGVLKASIEEFINDTLEIQIIKINLDLYQTGFDDPVWSGMLKGKGENVTTWETMLNTALSMAIKRWYRYPGYKDALVRLAGNITSPSPQPVVRQPSVKQQVVSGGTGFLFSSKDYVITNHHLVRGRSSIKITFLDGEVVDAKIVSVDKQNDIAFLKLSRSPKIPPSSLRIADSSTVKLGDKVFTIGYPASHLLGKSPKYSEGVINSIKGISDNPAYFQISVPIQPGNSGGPLFNERGEVIGITTSSLDSGLAKDSMGALPQNVNYAVKSLLIKNLMPTIPDIMVASRGIVVVPTEPENNLSNFIENVQNNIVLIEAKE